MKLSIVIVNYNTAKITLRCLKSLERFPASCSFEVILVDNGSSDDSNKLLKNFKTKAFDYSFLKNKDNKGFAKANNQGIKKSRGEYVLLLNSDTKVTSKALDNLLEAGEKSKSAGVVGAQLLNEDGSIQPSVFRFPTIARTIKHYILGREILDKYYPKKSKKMTEVEVVVFAAALITPNAIKRVGMLDERYFMYFEDFEYCKKVREAGLKVYYLPNSKIFHIHGASGSGDWRRLIKSSKIYHGRLRHYIIFFITWFGQKITKF